VGTKEGKDGEVKDEEEGEREEGSTPAVSTLRIPTSPRTTTGFRSGSFAAASTCHGGMRRREE